MIGSRPVGPADAALLAMLHAECFPDDPWHLQAMREVLAMPGTFGFMAEAANSEPIGFLLAQALAGSDCEILALGVRPAMRRCGIGRALLLRLLAATDQAKQTVFLEVAEDNPAARTLYAAAGFAGLGRRPSYYRRRIGGPVAALQLRREPQ